MQNANQLVLNHIQNHCNPNMQSEGWLHNGLNLIISNNCPFCGQVLENAQSLIDAYREYFDNSFVQFESNTRQRLVSIPREIRSFNFSRIIQNINLILTLLTAIPNYYNGRIFRI